MSMYQDKSAPVQRFSDLTPEEVAAIVREAHRLRRQAVASVASALAHRIRRALRRVSSASPGKAAIGRSL